MAANRFFMNGKFKLQIQVILVLQYSAKAMGIPFCITPAGFFSLLFIFTAQHYFSPTGYFFIDDSRITSSDFTVILLVDVIGDTFFK